MLYAGLDLSRQRLDVHVLDEEGRAERRETGLGRRRPERGARQQFLARRRHVRVAPARAQVDVSTLKVICTAENIANPNAVKVVTDGGGRALYFSRATIPFHRDAAGPAPQYWKHIGLYAYRKRALNLFPTLPASALERAERLEQLRFLENGLSIYVEPTEHDTIGVDTEDDLRMVEARLRTRHIHGSSE